MSYSNKLCLLFLSIVVSADFCTGQEPIYSLVVGEKNIKKIESFGIVVKTEVNLRESDVASLPCRISSLRELGLKNKKRLSDLRKVLAGSRQDADFFKKVTLAVLLSKRPDGEVVVDVYPNVRFGPRIGRVVAMQPETWRYLDGHLVQVQEAGKWAIHVY